jgi:glutamate synthase domain-containing protein 3
MAAALGADEYGFGTAALVAIGCVMARQCHLNNCPAGIATQKPELRAKYDGTPEQVIAYFRMVAEEVRAILASLGMRSLGELVGRIDRLRVRDRAAAGRVDLDRLLGPVVRREPLEANQDPDAGPAGRHTLNGQLLAATGAHFETGITIHTAVRNTDRAVGATLAGAIVERYGDAGLADATIRIALAGSAGQSLGAFGVPGLEITVIGEANDGVAKGLHGGTVAIAPPADATVTAPALIGNAALYGATGGRLFVAGRAGERFAVRNSGATAVVEGVGHHGCEYMTAGTVVVLGPTGPNFGAGMTGGVVFAYDPDRQLESRVNAESVAIGGLTEDDEAAVCRLLIEHRRATGSRQATELLNQWAAVASSFCRVTPNAAGATAIARPVQVRERLRA